MAYPSRVVPPPARWQGEAAHVGVADYAPEGSDVFMRLYYPTLSRPPRRGPLWVPSVHYAHGMAHFLVDFTNPKRRWWQKSWHVRRTSSATSPTPCSTPSP